MAVKHRIRDGGVEGLATEVVEGTACCAMDWIRGR